MCHLCRKVECLQDVDSKTTKPILVALSKLHRHVEPRLGDLWLWRLEETTNLRALLGGLHKLVPAKAIGAILNEVDRDLYVWCLILFECVEGSRSGDLVTVWRGNLG